MPCRARASRAAEPRRLNHPDDASRIGVSYGRVGRALLIGTGIGDAIGAALSAWAVGGLQNQMAWSSVVLYGALCIGCTYFLATPASRMARTS